MSLVLKSNSGGKKFEPHPQTDGFVDAVVVDITPPKEVKTNFGVKEKFRVVYESEVEKDDGERFCVWSRPYGLSLHPKSAFRPDLEKIIGRKLDLKEEQEGFEVEDILGMGVQLLIQHEEGDDDQVYTRIAALRAAHDNGLKPSGNYVRVCDREEKEDSTYRKAPDSRTEEEKDENWWRSVKVHVGTHAGTTLGELDSEAITKLIDFWLPEAKKKEKPLKADRELMEALDWIVDYISKGEEEEAEEAEEECPY